METTQLDLLKKDLVFQLTFENIDWDYFIDIAIDAKNEANKEKE